MSFAAPDSIPHESWNTNLELVSKTNSSLIS